MRKCNAILPEAAISPEKSEVMGTKIMVRQRPTRLKLWRLAHAMSPAAFGAPHGLAATTVREIESGRLNPSPRVRLEIEQRFGEPWSQLMAPMNNRRGLPREREFPV